MARVLVSAVCVAHIVMTGASAVQAASPGQTATAARQPSTTLPETVRVIVDGAALWSGPQVPVAMTWVQAGTLLEVLAHEGTWYRVRFPFDSSRVGYVM